MADAEQTDSGSPRTGPEAAPPAAPPASAVQVGVVLGDPGERPGAWIANARAFDTARAHAL